MMNKDIFNIGVDAGNSHAGNGKRHNRIERVSRKDIAIIGMSGRLPKADNLRVFWDNLLAGMDGVAPFPAARVAEVNNYLAAAGLSPLSAAQFKEKGFLENIDRFDNKFFNISYKEACLMNPAQRLFLEVVWHAIQDAAYAPASLRGTRTGVYVGFTERNEGYYNLVKELEPELTGMAHPGNVASILASRISYLLDLKGPAVLVDTACSSSHVAVHTACQALRNGEIDMAIAGAVNLSWLPVKAPEGAGIGIESKGGRARTFDDHSDGTVGGEGVVAVLLKPYSAALRDRDHVIALIKGSAINQDGRSIGITAPSVLAQVDVIEKAWQNAGIDPETISYIEAHGTATNLGDPIEIEAITQAFRKYTRQKQFCAIGAVKTNVGHLDAAAGMAGLVKAALALKHRQLPPSIHFERPNRKISFETSPVYVNDTLRDWETTAQAPRRCGVSAFGISGTNCHLVLEEAPLQERPPATGLQPLVVCCSAKNEQELLTTARQLLEHLRKLQDYYLEDVCFTLNTGREHLQYRFALQVNDKASLESQLEQVCLHGLPPAPASTKEEKAQANRAAAQLLQEWEVTPDARLVPRLCELYLKGADIDWEVLYANSSCYRMSLPGYPFEAKRCWVTYPEKVTNTTFMNAITQTNNQEHVAATGKERIMSQIKEVIAGVFELAPEEIDTTASFLEMGLDSISIIQVKQMVRSKYNIDISIDTLFNEAASLDALSAYISRHLPPEPAPPQVTAPTAAPAENLPPVDRPAVDRSALESIVEQQLKIMADQLRLLHYPGALPAVEQEPFKAAAPPERPVPAGRDKAEQQGTFQWTSTAFQDFDEQQRRHLADFITAFNRKTAASKLHVQQSRAHFANNRNTAHYNKTLKELSYPIIMKAAKGARVWDLDDNEYIDMSMGFGVFLLGYNHPVVEKAVQEYAGNFFLGPMSHLPGEVAQLLHELTGVDRAAFYNSGTEAVMVALRLARAATGRNKIVMFAGSYHGTFDGVLAQRDMFSGNYNAVPKGAGIPHKMLEDVLLLDYGSDTALEVIREHAHELAAVLVEPVQSRRPEFQPADFLHALRVMTEELGIALIFDEIISGFRIHPGGCQRWLGIQADLVTYGKICGGGLPLGIVAGKSAFMHGVDGGENWQYGDDSHPVFDHRKTFVAGTFCHHPLSMAAASAMLRYLKEQGPILQDTLNKRMEALAAELNAFFTDQGLPVSIVHFGSLFQIRAGMELSLFFHYLAYKGIYVWEGMTLFISPAHTDSDIAAFIQAVKTTVFEMQEKGFLVSNTNEKTGRAPAPARIPLTYEQKRLWFTATAHAQANTAFNARRSFNVREAVSIPALKEAVRRLAARHEILQTVRIDGAFLHLQPALEPEIITDEEAMQQPFDLANGPLFRIAVLGKSDGSYEVLFMIHSIIADGWSLNVLSDELLQLYIAATANTVAALPPAPSFRQYVEWMQAEHASPLAKEAVAFWKEQLKQPVSSPALPAGVFRNKPQQEGAGAGWVWVLTKQHTESLRKFAQENGLSMFMLLLGAFEGLLYRLCRQSRMVIGIPASGQLLMEAPGMVGQCNQIIPYIHEVNGIQPFRSFLKEVKQAWLGVYKHQRFSCLDLLQQEGEEDRFPDIRVVFNMDPAIRHTEVEEAQEDVVREKPGENKYDFFLNAIEAGGSLRLHFQFNKHYYPEKIVRAWIDHFSALLYGALERPETAVDELPVVAAQSAATAAGRPPSFPQEDTQAALHVLLEQIAAANPARAALTYDGATYTYQHINHIAGCFAGYLQGLGMGNGQVIAVRTNGVYETLVAALAVLKAGSAYTLQTRTLKELPVVEDGMLEEWLARQQPGMNGYLSMPASGAAIAKVASGLEVSHRRMIDQLNAVAQQTGPEVGDAGYELVTAGLGKNIWTDIVLSGWLQARHVMVNEQRPGSEAEGVFFLDRSLWIKLLLGNDTAISVPGRQLAIISTTPVTDLHTAWWKDYLRITDRKSVAGWFYAPPDAPFLLSWNRLPDADSKIAPPGIWPVARPLAGNRYVVQDGQDKVLPDGVYGRLLVQVDNRLWQTGIPARLLGAGEAEIDVFSQQESAGRQLLAEMIMLHTGIPDVRIDDRNGHVCLVTAQFPVAKLMQLMQYLHEAGVPEQRQPLRYGVIPPEMLDADGAFDERAVTPLIPAADQQLLQADPVEEKVIALFRKLFPSRKFFTVDDNFFALGGNSINGIQLLSWIYREWGIKLDIAQLFECPAIKQLAGLIRKAGYGEFTHIPRLPEAEDYEASHAQKRLWILHQNEHENLAYNMSSTYVLQEGFDKAAFERALLTVVERHEILRTTLCNKEGALRQQIHAPGSIPFRLEVTDLKQDPDREKQALEIAVQERNTVFDLERGPLLRARLLEMETDRSIFIFTLHHIVSDGWSKEILTNEVLCLYTAYMQNKPADLPPLPIQYKDFAHWQNAQIGQGEATKARDYWLKHFSGDLPVLEIPADYPRPSVRSQNGANCAVQIDADLLQHIIDLANRNECTLFTFLFAVVKVLLYKCSGQDDIIIGLPVSGRDHPDTENLVGLFVHTLPIRTSFKGSDSFTEFLQLVRRNMMDAYRHQVYPVDQLVEDLNISWEISRRPLFDVIVNWPDIHTGIGNEEQEGLAADTFSVERNNSMFDLSFSFIAMPGNCQELNINYNTDIYAAHSIQRMLERFIALLRSIVQDSGQRIDRLEYLPVEEKNALLEFSGPGRAVLPAPDLVTLFEATVQRCAHQPALRCEATTLSYVQMNEQANRLADCLVKDYGIRPGDSVGIMVGRNEWMVAGVLGILKAGAAYVPVDPEYPADRVNYIIADSGINVLVTETEEVDTLAPVQHEMKILDLSGFKEKEQQYDKANRLLKPGTDSLAYLVYTSGSTGNPKGVMIGHRELLGLWSSLGTAYRLDRLGIRLLQVASLSFDVFFGDMLRSIFRGGVMVICPAAKRYDLPGLYELMQKERITMVESTPGLLLPLLDYIYEEGKDISFLEILNMGSDMLSVEDYRRAYERFAHTGIRIINSYGTTETTIDSSLYEGVGADLRPLGYVPIGRPLENSRIYVLDRNLQYCGIGITGELCIGGAGVGRGYQGRPDLTAQRYLENPHAAGERLYRTGDLARWTPEGNVEFLGRGDNQVKIRGYRVELGEVESVLQSYNGVREAVVLAQETGGTDRHLVSYIVWKDAADEEGLRTWMREKLPMYMHPAYYVAMDRLPLTSNGKVDRRQLPVPEMAETGAYEAPRNEVEAALVKIWEEVLQRERIGIKDNFFDLGGHSLKGIRVLWRVRKDLGVDISFPDIFNYPRIMDLAVLISQSAAAGAVAPVPVLPAQPRYELSHGQLRMWILAQMEESRSAYNMCMSFELREDIDLSALSGAFEQLIARHEILRTIFLNDHEGVWQVVQAPADSGFNVNVVDLTAQDVPAQQEYLAKLSATEVRYKFDLGRGPLLHAHLLRMKEEFAVLLINMHHIISDGWSVDVMMEELTSIYEGLVSGKPAVLEPLKIQYKDYAAQQNKLLNSPEIAVYKNYWLEQFSGELPVLNLPLDHIRPAVRSYRGATVRTVLGREDTHALQRFVQREPDKSMFMVLLACTYTLLYRYTGQEDMVLGVLVAGREHDDLLGQIGLYVNTLALRTRFSGQESFDSLLEKVQESLLGAFEHQVYPFDLLVEDLNITGDRSRSPLFDVLVTYKRDEHADDIQENQQNEASAEELDMGDLQREDSNISKFDITVNFREQAGGLYISINYNTDIFDETRIHNMLRHLQEMTRSVCRHTGQPLSGMKYLTDKETKDLLEKFNDTAVPYPQHKTIHGLIEAQAARTPHNTAVIHEGVSLTYDELNRSANRLAHYLAAKHGLGPGKVTGVQVERSEKMIICLLAILKTGAAYVPIDGEYPEERIQYIIADSRPDIVLKDHDLDSDMLQGNGYSDANPNVQTEPSDLAYLIYTSGSTGRPKGVALMHRNAVSFIDWCHHEFNTEKFNTVLALTSYCFDLSIFEMFYSLSAGKQVLVLKSVVDMQKYVECMPDVLLNTVPSVIDSLIRLGTSFSNVRLINMAGEPVPRAIKDHFRGSGIIIRNLYGPSEDTTYSTCYRFSDDDDRILIGKPISNTRVYILDAANSLVPVGFPGELCIAGAGLARGYLNQEQLTTQRFVPNPFEPGERMYRTGDIARWTPDGNIEFLGRNDDQVKIRGYRIELGEIQQVMVSYEAVQEGIVLAVPLAGGERDLVGYVVWSGTPDEVALQRYMKNKLPVYMQPAHFVALEKMPLNSNGKIDKKALPVPQSPAATGVPAESAGSPVEEALTAIWEDVLQRKGIGISDNFFEIGGHSLKGMRVLARINATFNVRFTLKDIFRKPTIKQQAAAIAESCPAPAPVKQVNNNNLEEIII
ncbi:non-ribosomal peptide synthetase [Chitinophaga japonensis]|uniref:Amino acid adenylation domain-containing protein n=1 Tax=Chitinophaga japonensis TaxID=104662 RepID=A0A562SN76_CHIJA|nr:non-ribosomal peptide synthetase [Chitinophaga japonensis]TWI82120.1 amino acid adenylation domain-containing protein [Chitinophaga japonensis]